MRYTINSGAELTVTTSASGYSISAPSGSTVRILGIAGYSASPSLPMDIVMTFNKTQNFTVTPDGTTQFTLSGTVKEAPGNDVVGAEVRYRIDNGAEQSVFTTGAGYSISAPSGSTVTITGVIGYIIIAPSALSFVMTSDRTQNLTVTPDGTTKFTLSGTVMQSGSPVIGAQLRYTVDNGAEQTTFTTDAGYSISAPSGSTVRILGIAGYSATPSLPMDIVMTFNKTQDFTVTPSGSFTLSGTVKDTFGNDVVGAEITYRINGGPEQSVFTTGAGYSISAPAGSTLVITGVTGYTITAPSTLSFVMTSDRTQNLTVTPDGTTQFTLSGTVMQSGSAVIGAQLRYTVNGGAEQSTFTTASGYSISAPSGSTVRIIGITGYIATPSLPMDIVIGR
jgi:uncharacterized protein YaiE (UPF0345 family)